MATPLILIQLFIVALLSLAIVLQVAMRGGHANHHSSSLSSLGGDFLADFYTGAAEAEARAQQRKEDVLSSSGSSTTTSSTTDSTIITTTTTNAQEAALETDLALIRQDTTISSHHSLTLNSSIIQEQLGCIDIVRRCMKYRDSEPPFPLPTVTKQQDKNHSEFSTKTAALGAPVLKGGYRNQYMRFVGLVAMALAEGYDSILLESIKWHEKATHNAVPFEMLFDVNHWNTHAELPKLVTYNPREHYQWSNHTTNFIGACPTIIKWFETPHKTSIYEKIKMLQYPVPLGGSRSGQTKNLWDYYRSRDKYGMQIDVLTTGKSVDLGTVEKWVLQAMKPSTIVHALMAQLHPNAPYIALHPRIEPEMMNHAHCQEFKIRSLQTIMDQVLEYPEFASYKSMFVAVAMPQMMVKKATRARWFKDHMTNLDLLHSLFSNGTTTPHGNSDKMDVWTAGESALEELKVNSCMIQLLASIVNMELAIESSVFVGTSVSTWSTSVWKIRHFLGKPNYEFTQNGIVKLDGLPPPFKC